MKRRELGLMTTGLLAAAGIRPGRAQTAPDPSLLTTSLTPLGAERAGNADGSIPAWTGGVSAPPGTPVAVKMFDDEAPLFTVDASNLDQHKDKVPNGIQWLITHKGFSLKVYPTHRTAAAPQYVYDNVAKNVTRASLDPKGGRFGFEGAYGGTPFPIINTADPDMAGEQLIWNHLTAWQGFCQTSFSPGFVMTGGELVLTEGGIDKFRFPYYDPDGSPETFDGYLSKTHLWFQAPASFNGQEVLSWHSANVNKKPDITWVLLNGQGRVRKAPIEAYDTPNQYFNSAINQDENSAFYGNPSQYDWKYIGKQEMYVPYHCQNIAFIKANDFFLKDHPNPEHIRWEKHRVWIVEATLHPGIYNVMAKRRFYIDEDTWFICTGESYDKMGSIARIYLQFLRAEPVFPCTSPVSFVCYTPQTGAYCYAGYLDVPPYTIAESTDIIQDSIFSAQQMSTNASF